MAVTQNNYTGDGSTVLYSFTFPYLATTDVKVKLDGVNTTEYTLANATTVQLNSAPANGVKIIIFRNTDNDNKKATFYPGSAIKAEDLNNNIDQILYVAQEVDNNAMSSLGDTAMQGDLEMGQGMGIVFEGSTTDDFETRLAVANPTADRTVTLPNVTGTVVTTGDTGTVTSAMITDATIVNADINASAAIAQSKLNIANATTSAAGYESAADKTKLDGIETAATADQTAAEIRTLVESATDSNVFTDADHSKLNAIEAGATTDQTAAEIRTLVGNASDSNVFTDAESTKLAGIETAATADQTASEIKTLIASSPLDASHLAANSVGDSEIATGALDNRYYTEAESDARYFNVSTGDTIKDGDAFPDNDTTIATTAAINDRIIDLVDDVGGFVPIANETSFPNANPDVNNGTGTLVSIKALSSNLTSNGSGVATIANGTVGNSTVTITGLDNSTTYNAGFGMIVETTTTLNTYTFHRQVPKATEVTTVAGSISNVNSVASNISNVNSVAGNASNINSTVSNASNINTVAGSISNVNTVSTNISSVNDFADKYRIASSAPGSNNDDGDLYYNTSDNKLYVYNGSAWEVASSLNGSGGSVTGDTTFTDNTKIKLGTGADLQIYHDGTRSWIQDANAGNLIIDTNGSEVDINSGSNAEYMGRFIKDGAVELYYDNSKKLETKSYGLSLHGNVLMTNTDNQQLKLGAGNDLEIYHDGSNSIIDNNTGDLIIRGDGDDVKILAEDDIVLRDNDDSTNFIHCINGGAVELYHDGVKMFYTSASGVHVESGGNAAHLHLLDGGKARFGASDDLQIYHDGTNNYIDGHNGVLYIRGATQVISLQATDTEHSVRCAPNAEVQLYYDNVKKFETNADGTLTQGTIQVNGAEGATGQIRIHADEGDDNADRWRLVANTDGTFGLQNLASGSYENSIKATGDGNVELYHNNSKKFETTSTGVSLTGDIKLRDNDILRLGDTTYGDLKVYHTGAANIIDNAEGHTLHIRYTASEEIAKFIPDGAVELYYDNAKKLETTSSGVDVTGSINATGQVKINDSFAYIAGTGDDLQIYHNGSNSTLSNTTGYFHVSNTNGIIYLDGNNTYIRNGAASEYQAKFIANGAVDLYYDGSKKFETTSTGAAVTGSLGIGTTSPDTLLHLAGADTAIIRLENTDTSLTTDQVIGGLEFEKQDGSGAGAGVVGGLRMHSGVDGITTYLTLSTSNSSNNNVEALRITSDRHVQIDNDTGKLQLGASQDLQIFHNGTHSYIANQTGNFHIEADTCVLRSASQETYFLGSVNGASKLYYDNALKFETTSGGVLATGNIETSEHISLTGDNKKLKVGAGEDLQIYHDASDSYIANSNGALIITQHNNDIKLRPKTAEEGIIINNDGSVELYYNGVKKLETTSTGATLSGNLRLDLGSGNDAYIYNSSAGGLVFQADENGHVFQTWSSSWETRLTITDGGNVRVPDNGKFTAGASDDLQIYHDGTHSYIDDAGTGNLYIRNGTDNSIWCGGAVNLYYDDSKKFETTSYGTYITGIGYVTGGWRPSADGGCSLGSSSYRWYDLNISNDIDISDNGVIQLGDGDDLKIYHDGSNSYIDNTTGTLRIRDSEVRICNTDNETYFAGTANGESKLYYDDSVKLETTSNGVFVSGKTYINTASASAIDSQAVLAVRASFGTSGCGVEIKHDGNPAAGRDFIRFYNTSDAEAGSIEHDAATSVQYLTSSDYRLKENIANITDGIERLKLLKPRKFSWKDDPELGLRDGFIAHEVSPAIPHCVSGEKDAVKEDGSIQIQSMEYSQLTPLLTAALQEAITKIEVLETKVAALESS